MVIIGSMMCEFFNFEKYFINSVLYIIILLYSTVYNINIIVIRFNRRIRKFRAHAIGNVRQQQYDFTFKRNQWNFVSGKTIIIWWYTFKAARSKTKPAAMSALRNFFFLLAVLFVINKKNYTTTQMKIYGFVVHVMTKKVIIRVRILLTVFFFFFVEST